jgi:hypothetical protein
MSAAEKLKALHQDERDGDLWFALPQIVAVVEAAEESLPPEGHHGHCESRSGGKCDCFLSGPKYGPQYAALSALDEALGD